MYQVKVGDAWTPPNSCAFLHAWYRRDADFIGMQIFLSLPLADWPYRSVSTTVLYIQFI